MTKLMYLVLGLLVLSGTALMVAPSPGARDMSKSGQGAMDIGALERTMDLKALPKDDLDPTVYE